MMDNTTAQLVDFALGVRFGALDTLVVHEIKRRIIDTAACALGAFDDPTCAVIRELSAGYGEPAQATLWGTPLRCSAEMAAFANSVLVRFQDFNDTFSTQDGGHPSDIIPGVVAAAEIIGANGRAVIAAVAVGYEVFCRFMQSYPVSEQNFDQTLNVIIATTAALGNLLDLPRAQLGHAISLALTPNLALRQTRQGQLSHWKGCAAANAVKQAMFAVTLAQRGITGPSDIFEGKQGFWSVVGKREWVEPHLWNQMTMVGRTYLKNLPVCYHGQAAAQAAIGLSHRIAPASVRSIVIDTYGEARRMIGSDPSRWAPRSRETADHSLPFIVASCLATSRLAVDSFDESRLADALTVDLMSRVVVREETAMNVHYPYGAPARVTVDLEGGASVSAEVIFPKGHPKDPLSDAELDEKFTSLVRGVNGGDGSAALLRTLWSLEDAGDIGRDVTSKMVVAGNAARPNSH